MPTHAEKRTLPHTPEQLFELVAGIDRYPEFLPWCTSARITKREGNLLHADITVGFKVFREKFTSRVTLDRPHRVDVKYLSGPFRYLNNHWIFHPEPDGHCTIEFFIDFEFRSRLLQRLIGALFNEAVKHMVRAFEIRAGRLYGTKPQLTAKRRRLRRRSRS
ncbi:MAG TPA: type II toxin-antitoxin system RatA family toxin [Alphaproteobacteria bacterium]|jgi:coenzyme Q-binding protein COQ10|nr:type II toxin-antitoxin system RatA family toxin [Alphaproteobacteria bacterium]